MYFVVLIPYAIMGYSHIISAISNTLHTGEHIFPTSVSRELRIRLSPMIQCFLVCAFVFGICTSTDILTQDTDKYNDYLSAEQLELRMVPFNKVDSRSRKLNKAKSLVAYCAQLSEMEDVTVAVAVRDIQGYCLRPDEIDMLQKLGFDELEILLEHTYHSFLGVSCLNGDHFQQIGDDELIQQSVTLNDHIFQLTSATWQTGDIAKIIIDDVDWAVNKRGINIVVMDNNTGDIIDTVAFDTHLEGHKGYR